MENIDKEIAFYEANKNELQNTHMGKWVLIRGEKIVNFFDSFDAAAQEAVEKFGSGPYLIRQVGSTPVVLPTSVVYNL